MIKVCVECKTEKSTEQFCVVRKNKDGRNIRCKICCNSKTREWRKQESSKKKISDYNIKWRSENREDMRTLKKAYRDRNPERARAIVRKALHKHKEKYKPQQWRQALKRLYNLDAETFYRMQASQNNLCAICEKPERDVRRRKLCVDHCHMTGVVRGLLCFSCNVILGNAKDNPELLKKAVTYLENSLKLKGNE